MKKSILLSILCVGLANELSAQETPNPLTISGYAEVYAQYEINNPKNNQRPDFVYSLNRNNEVSLNLGLLHANYNTEKVRANLGLGFGSYMNANYSAEKGVLKNLYEANVGVRLSDTHNIWLDAGVLPSHIGFESAVGADCFTLSRSIMAENSPYFETGVKLSYQTENQQWELALLALNGWQRIERIDGNSTPAFGYQVTFTPSEKVSFNASSFIGNDQPDDQKMIRYFHDLYGQFQLSPQVTLVAGFDIGAEQKMKNSDEYNVWYGTSAVLNWLTSERTSLALRGEYYNDKNSVMIATNTPNGFQTTGFSANMDYKISSNVWWRTEVKNLSSKDKIFVKRNGEATNQNWSLLTSLAVRF